MTTGKFEYVNIDAIIVQREDRQRKELTNIEELAESIRANGLINPIVVTPDLTLVAGERRLTAHKLLQYDQIAVQYTDQLGEDQLQILELEENIRRENLTWQDHVHAVSRYHKLREAESEDWSVAKTSEELNFSRQKTVDCITLSRALDEEVPEVVKAPKQSVALNFMLRKQERQKAAAMREFKQEIVDTDLPSAESSAETPSAKSEDLPARFADIQQADFIEWADTVQTNPFNLIHCDFPYGTNIGDKSGQSSAKILGQYSDTKDVYFSLLEAFCNKLDNFCAPSAHLVFWFSMDYYQETLDKLRAAGWIITPFPLIWYKNDNTGILPDPNRGPRRIYETAFFGYRGGRPVVHAVANAVSAAAVKGADKIHTSEKPKPVLDHFFRMLVDDTTRLLDPTCGSGNSVFVAEDRGAEFSLGLDLEKDYVDRARVNLNL